MSFIIGCDLELISQGTGQFVPVHNFIKSHSSFGLDGCESTAELRPEFRESSFNFTNKIYVAKC